MNGTNTAVDFNGAKLHWCSSCINWLVHEQ
jgi:hypothetical protein